jgi:hypothetical protein
LGGDDVSVSRQPIELLFVCSREQIHQVENRLQEANLREFKVDYTHNFKSSQNQFHKDVIML